jgi:uncharacterized protein YyaL (SSP411 family)
MNRLSSETSPYLRQHRANPVDWYPWGAEAFAAAAESDKPILLSVGYSACHWCHVMAHESFEDPQVAEVMNQHFVNVKVDREERPDVDALYMEAVQAMTGRGGWPMTVFLTPDARPFYGGTYFPKTQFLQLLHAVDDVWRSRRDDVESNVDALMGALRRSSTLIPSTSLPGKQDLTTALTSLVSSFDTQWGGFGPAPKFPNAMNLELVMRMTNGGDEPEAPDMMEVITTTLDAMASGGIYDHLGGGFARYSVDDRWLVPHFEKMLYDQALLARLYVHGWQLTGNPNWAQVVDETIEYALRDLRHADGGFYSAEDADSEGVEGRFYVWTPEQFSRVLGSDAEAAAEWYGLREDGNFEGATILNRMHARGQLLRPAAVSSARSRLWTAREERVRLGKDDKVLCEWNGLMVATLAEAGAAFQRPDWLAAARDTAEFLLGALRGPSGRWYRSWQADAGPRHEAMAADHASLVDAFVRLAEATGQARWVEEAISVADALLDRFWDPIAGGVYTTPNDGETLVVRQKDILDSATPSANSMAAVALVRLAALTGEQRFSNHAERILALVADTVRRAPAAFGHLLAAVDLQSNGITEIVVVGERPDLVEAVQTRYLPRAVLAWGQPYASPLWEHRSPGLAYVCEHYACQEPQTSVDGLVGLLT